MEAAPQSWSFVCWFVFVGYHLLVPIKTQKRCRHLTILLVSFSISFFFFLKKGKASEERLFELYILQKFTTFFLSTKINYIYRERKMFLCSHHTLKAIRLQRRAVINIAWVVCSKRNQLVRFRQQSLFFFKEHCQSRCNLPSKPIDSEQIAVIFLVGLCSKSEKKKLSFLIIGHLFKVHDASMTVCELWALFF